MATEELLISSVIAAIPNRIYEAWMDERHHSACTGSRTTVELWVGGRIISKGGYVDATHICLMTGSQISMTWRTPEFPEDAKDSQVHITFKPIAGGTKVQIHQTGIPTELYEKCKTIWRSQYLVPIKKYFTKPEAMRATYNAAKKAGRLPLSGIPTSLSLPRRPTTTTDTPSPPSTAFQKVVPSKKTPKKLTNALKSKRSISVN